MSRIIFPVILICIALVAFFGAVSPAYKEMATLKSEVAGYDEALRNSRSLEEERDKLTQKFNSISTTDLDRIEKLVPDNGDNIRLILEIEKIASPYGMVLKDVHYEAVTKEEKDEKGGAKQGGATKTTNQEFGAWDLEFATDGTYENFTNFLADLEQNLRVVDVVSIQFASGATEGASTGEKPYKYKFKIKTYWLKN